MRRASEAAVGTGHAVVIGAGMAGLAMAKSLTARFERITVLDRDRVRVGHRRGVPQDRHVHLLLPAGLSALEELFPGLSERLIAGGAAAGGTDRIRMCFNGHRLAAARTGHRCLFASRPFLESHVRRRALEDPRIVLRGNARVVRLAPSADGRRVDGVEVASSGNRGPERVHAELVVDCSGRRSSLPAWLAELGYEPPAVDELPVDLHYTTLRYRLPDDVLGGDRHVLVGPSPDEPFGGAMTNVEDGSWIVTLFGMAGRRPPADVEAFERFAARLPIGDMVAALRAGRALDEPVRYRFPANRRHRYERLTAWPAGLLAAGDAVCSFNPIYGQGMSVAALEARALQAQLRSGPFPSARSWFRTISRVIDAAWDMAIGADLAVRAIEGPRALSTRAGNRYLEWLHAAAVHDPALTERLLRVAGLVDPPNRLLHPSTAARVLRCRLRAKLAGTTPEADVRLGIPRDPRTPTAAARRSATDGPEKSAERSAWSGQRRS